jgi:hypothetical protein
MTLEQRLAPLKGHPDAHLLMGSAALGTHARLNVLTLLAEVALCRSPRWAVSPAPWFS